MSRFKNYYSRLSTIDFSEFNKFLFTVIFKGFMKTEHIIPVMIAILLLYFGLNIETQVYVFFPQSNITAYLTFIILQIAIGLIILLIIPFTVILIFNYLCSIVNNISPRLLLPIKIMALVGTFTFTINFLVNQQFRVNEKPLLLAIWLGLYFLLVNMFLSYKDHKHPFKFSRGKAFFTLFFVVLVTKQLTGIFSTILQKINYLQVNPLVNIQPSLCELIVRHPNLKVAPANRTINNSHYFEVTSQGCNLYGNLIRVGFASDYSISLKDNLTPVIENGKPYNYYTRINCYSGTCFVENNIKHLVNHDEYQLIFNSRIDLTR